MKWNRIEVSWKLLKDNFAFGLFRSSHDDSENHDPIGRRNPDCPPKRRRAAGGLSPRRPGKAQRVFPAYRLLIGCVTAT